ncbi:MAG: hypothetical protein IJ093_00055 [Bacilli bacterium]|nr:hypothetical protein [Bacilli bacterium]
MASRMDKYYDRNQPAHNSRRSRNKDLYSEIYTYGKYSNIEGIAEIDNANQVDLTQVRQLLNNRENYQKERHYRRLTGDYIEPVKKEPKVTRRFPELEEKNYDIRDVLKEAREKKEPDDKERALHNTEYNILKNIDLKKALESKKYYPVYEEDEDDLKELIKTITNTSMLNKINDADLAADLLSDLQANDTQVGQLKNVKELLNDNTNVRTREVVREDPDYDKSFFTSSLKLNKSDFVDNEEEQPKPRIFNFLIITILVIIMIVCAVILAIKFF